MPNHFYLTYIWVNSVTQLLLKCLSIVSPPPWMLNFPKINSKSILSDFNDSSPLRHRKIIIAKKLLEVFDCESKVHDGSSSQTVYTFPYTDTSVYNISERKNNLNVKSLIKKPLVTRLAKVERLLFKHNSQHAHGPSVCVLIGLLLEACLCTGLLYIILSIGLKDELSKFVNLSYLSASSASFFTFPVGLWLFVFTKHQNPESLGTKIATTIFFFAEMASGLGAGFNLYRFVVDISENDKWYFFFTSQEKPQSLLNDGHKYSTFDPTSYSTLNDQECLRFVSQLHQGKCAKPHTILLLIIFTMIVLCFCNICFVWSILSFNINQGSFPKRKHKKKSYSLPSPLLCDKESVFDDTSDDSEDEENNLYTKSRRQKQLPTHEQDGMYNNEKIGTATKSSKSLATESQTFSMLCVQIWTATLDLVCCCCGSSEHIESCGKYIHPENYDTTDCNVNDPIESNQAKEHRVTISANDSPSFNNGLDSHLDHPSTNVIPPLGFPSSLYQNEQESDTLLEGNHVHTVDLDSNSQQRSLSNFYQPIVDTEIEFESNEDHSDVESFQDPLNQRLLPENNFYINQEAVQVYENDTSEEEATDNYEKFF